MACGRDVHGRLRDPSSLATWRSGWPRTGTWWRCRTSTTGRRLRRSNRNRSLGRGPERARFKGMVASINGPMVMRDTAVLLTSRRLPTVSTRPGALGYCMGGGYASPPRELSGSRGGGGLVSRRRAGHRQARQPAPARTEDAGPHLRRRRGHRPDLPGRAASALADRSGRGRRNTIETYENARHGFAVNGHLVTTKKHRNGTGNGCCGCCRTRCKAECAQPTEAERTSKEAFMKTAGRGHEYVGVLPARQARRARGGPACMTVRAISRRLGRATACSSGSRMRCRRTSSASSRRRRRRASPSV